MAIVLDVLETNRIIDHARRIINEFIDKEKIHKPDNSWGQFIYDTLFGHLKPFISKIPLEWFYTTERIKVENVCGTSCNLVFTFDSPRPWPRNFGKAVISDLAKGDCENLELKRHPIWTDFHKEVVDYYNRINSTIKYCEEFISNLRKLCSKYGTLEAALEAWPPLLNYLPEETKEKILTPKIVEVDLDKLTAVAAAMKMLR